MGENEQPAESNRPSATNLRILKTRTIALTLGLLLCCRIRSAFDNRNTTIEVGIPEDAYGCFWGSTKIEVQLFVGCLLLLLQKTIPTLGATNLL